MKQPELGQKILDLRKQRGLTQEELVEKCNINVRTIQRIEAGEVTPRPYTVKAILAALGYDFEDINTSKKVISGDFLAQLKTQEQEPDKLSYMVKTLLTACVFGGVYFLLGFPEFFADWYRFADDALPYSIPIYIVLKVSILISFVFFIKGFWVLGVCLQNTIIKFSVLGLLVFSAVLYIYDIVSLFYEFIPMSYFLSVMSVSYGAIGILFGIAMIQLSKHLGNMATLTGIFEIIVSFFFLTVLLSWLGYFLLIPLTLLEIILLYKASEVLKRD